jgi:hypothetical protein
MRLKTLNGAPLPQHLDFDEHALLVPSECNAFTAAIGTTTPAGTAPTLRWRRLQPKDARLRTGWSQPCLPGGVNGCGETDISIIPHIEQTSTFLPPCSTRDDTTVDINEQSAIAGTFLAHSLTFHDTLLSSQVIQDTVADQTISSSSFLSTSFGTTASELSSPSRTDGTILTLQVPPTMAITPLGSLPSAQHLRSIYPQTPTPNMLCVLMALPERREVFVRNGGYNMDLYEIAVADDTMSGFKVTFWLRPPRESNNEQSSVQHPLLQTLKDARLGDILLLRNIALTSFRDTVHGQSLNPSIARARTTVDVLMKEHGASAAKLEGLSDVLVQTFHKVKKWARIHVAGTKGSTRKRKGTPTERHSQRKPRPASSFQDDSLPPDTLLSIQD